MQFSKQPIVTFSLVLLLSAGPTKFDGFVDAQQQEEEAPAVAVVVEVPGLGRAYAGLRSDDGGVDAFLGIRYADVPGGRFSPSELAEGETTTAAESAATTAAPTAVDATAPGPYCYQAGFTKGDGSIDAYREFYMDHEQSEDCLYLNVWRPAGSGPGSNLTTMVWIHGGGYVYGSGAEPLYDGTELARAQDVVVVTLNYRLGVFGFLATKDQDGKITGGLNGIGDQINALRWVNKHIASFGGNPNDITVFGQSSGSMSVCLLSVSPLVNGLFHRSIQQSGECLYGPASAIGDNDSGWTQTLKILNETGAPSIEALSDPSMYPPADLAPHMAAPTVDGWVLPDLPKAMYDVPDNIVPTDVIIGSASFDNFAALAYTAEANLGMAAGMKEEMRATFGADAGQAIAEAYPPSKYGGNAVAAYSAYSGDSYFRCGSRALADLVAGKLAEKGGGKVFLYNYAHLSNFDPIVANGLQAAANITDPAWATHEADIPMVLGTVGAFPALFNAGKNYTYTGPTARDLAMKTEIMSRWANFAKTGDPNTDSHGGWSPVEHTSNPVPGRSTSVPTFVLQVGMNGEVSQMTDIPDKVEQCSAFPFAVFSSPNETAGSPSEPNLRPENSSANHWKALTINLLLSSAALCYVLCSGGCI